ncbi:hypothetical protein HAX54_004611 [Datura stramonium]|uniref:Uncharacterized protein n=1 Tax=Datura stramonium TaxID=4076 RepID=A0ABS8WVH0_DATST|nr:hypothetical protein [Datura stramonium]
MPAPQGSGSSVTAPTVPRRAIATPRAPGGTFLLTWENFTNIAVKVEREDKQHIRDGEPQSRTDETKTTVQELQDKRLSVNDTGLEQPRWQNAKGDVDETNEDALEEEIDPYIPPEEATKII